MGGLLRDLPIESLAKMAAIYEAKVIRKGGDECWGWKGYKDEKGYGKIRLPGPSKSDLYIRAHRFSFEYHVRRLEPGELVLHECDNPPCSNPKHLYAGGHIQNARDRVQRRRSLRGEKSPTVKITEAQAKRIRRFLEMGEFKSDIAREVGCGYQTVDLIATGETWKYLGPIKWNKKPSSECTLRKKHKPGGYKNP